MHAIEAGWLERVRACRLYAYEFDPAGFRLKNGDAGYWVVQSEVEPISIAAVGDLLARHVEARIELRIVPNLWPLIDVVVASGLEFSIVRKANALPALVLWRQANSSAPTRNPTEPRQVPLCLPILGGRDADCACITAHPSMYGPPPNCKRKMRGTGLVCAHVYGLGWSEKTPGQDGMRYALFPFITAVLEDFVRMRV